MQSQLGQGFASMKAKISHGPAAFLRRRIVGGLERFNDRANEQSESNNPDPAKLFYMSSVIGVIRMGARRMRRDRPTNYAGATNQRRCRCHLEIDQTPTEVSLSTNYFY